MNLGDVQKSPIIRDGKLILEYQDGDLCKVKNITVPHIKTTISFICDFEAMVIIMHIIYSYLIFNIFYKLLFDVD